MVYCYGSFTFMDIISAYSAWVSRKQCLYKYVYAKNWYESGGGGPGITIFSSFSSNLIFLVVSFIHCVTVSIYLRATMSIFFRYVYIHRVFCYSCVLKKLSCLMRSKMRFLKFLFFTLSNIFLFSKRFIQTILPIF